MVSHEELKATSLERLTVDLRTTSANSHGGTHPEGKLLMTENVLTLYDLN